MCGVVAILGGAMPAAARRERLSHMLGRIEHRGPDAFGTYVTPHVALGHVRLSIVDVAAGHQPFAIGDHCISYNGEVFNHIELRAELEALGEQFTTRSDTELLLRALMRWGIDALARCNGQFAFVWWDGARKRLIAARDRYGVRPLFFCSHQGAVYFVSELKALDIVPGLRRQLDPENVLELGLFWNNLGERTPYRGVRTLEPGTCLVFGANGGEPERRRYHQLGYLPPGDLPASFDEAKAMLRDKLSRAVSLRLRSDVPVGNYLSGGIDSSVITLLTDRLRSDTYRTFSIAFRDPAFDESGFQAQLNQRLHARSFTLTIDDADIERHFEAAVYHAERPLFRTAPVPLWLLARQVRDSGIRVVLTGEAADEILWGYDSYKELKLLQFWAKHPDSKLRPQLLRTLYPHLAHYRDPKQFGLMRMFYEGFLSSYDNALLGLNLRVHNNRILAAYLRHEHKVAIDDQWLASRLQEILPAARSEWTMLQRNQFLEMRTLLDGYLLSSQGDRMSLAHGIEGRYPFLDHELVEWAFHLPDRYKLPLLSQKHLLREAFRGELPESIIDRPKQPYQAPDLKAFFPQGRLSAFASEHLSASAVERVGLFEPRMVQRFVDKWRTGVPAQVGYRDNMLLCFLLSTQLAARDAAAQPTPAPPHSPRTVDVMLDA
ncbi:MAG TPA: asparagine synthase (glutamine-hydrolyzing) [Polyangiales bacterium]